MSNQSIATSVAPESFNFENFTVRAINRNGDIWFIAADVCAVLDIKNTSDALKNLDDDECLTLDIGEGQKIGRGGAQKFNIINESGLYALILRSRKPEAKRFRKWVTSEVLPAIRKTGSYSVSISKAQQGELATLIAERFPSVPVLSIAISEAMCHTVFGFSSPKQKAQSAVQSDGAFSMRDASPMGEADGASSDAPVPFARSANPSVSPTRLAAGSEFYNLQKETIMQTDAGMLQPVRLEIDGLSFRIFNINNRPWFAATDVCTSLGLLNPSKSISSLRECERYNLKLERGGSLNLINESGLYTLILRCDAAIREGTDAFKFRVKVTDEILPSLREHGFYAVQNRTISKAQQGELATLIAERFPSGKDRPYAWSRFNNHFRLASYKDLPASRFEEACAYIRTMPEIAPALPKPEARPQINLFAPNEFQRLRVLANQFYDDVVKRAKGEDVTPKLEIPDEVLAGIVAGQLCSTNHTIGFTHDGRMMIWKTPDPFDVVVNLIEDPGWVQPERVKKVLDACMTALTNRLGLGGTK